MIRTPTSSARRAPILLPLAVAAILATVTARAQAGRFLFDATKSEMAGNADWVIDSDSKLSNESNPARFPTPAQSGITASTAETYWTGAISAWGVTMVKHSNSVESLPRSGSITYGSTSNAQDLSHYKTFVVDEPNNAFTLAEKQALLNFVKDGGGLFMVSDHTGADRDNDGIDAAGVWNDFFTNNGVVSNPFGIAVNLNDISQVSTNVLSTAVFKTGTAGTAANLEFNDGATLTLSTSANSSVKAAVLTNGSAATNTTNAMMAYATYGLGRVVMLGDSSPADDGTGDTGDTLFAGWSSGTNGVLISNASDWVNASSQSTYDATAGGSWATAASWTGVAPDAADAVVDFKGAITADAAVTLDRARTVANLRFAGTHAYTIAGAATITFGTSPILIGVLPGVIVNSGSHTITAPLVFSLRGDFNVASAASVLTLNTVTGASGANLSKSGAGRLDVVRIDGSPVLNVAAGKLHFTGTSASSASVVTDVSITAGAMLDLEAGALVIGDASPSALATIKTYLADGRLTTSAAGLTIGYAEASDLSTTNFADVTVDSTALLLRATVDGDTNLDLSVDFADLLALAKHYGAAGEWSAGDFNRSGTVDFSDLLVLAKNYQTTTAATDVASATNTAFAADWALAQSLAPEPATLSALLLVVPMIRRRR